VIYDIRHVTTYRYDDVVASARCTLRLLPGAGPATAPPRPVPYSSEGAPPKILTWLADCCSGSTVRP
jgi:hypothetical protein